MCGPGEVEEKKQERQGGKGEVLEERVRDVVRTGCCGGRETGDRGGELREAKGGAEGRVDTGGGTELTEERTGFVAAGFKRGTTKMKLEKRSVTGGKIFVGIAPGKGWIRRGGRVRGARNRAEKGKDLTGLGVGLERRCCSVPRLGLGFGNGGRSSAVSRKVGLAVLFTEMRLAIRLTAFLHKFSQLRGPPSLRGLAG